MTSIKNTTTENQIQAITPSQKKTQEIFTYDRNFGFSKCDWKKLKLPESKNFLKNYCGLIKEDKRFRLLTNKLIERFFFFTALIILIVMFILKEYAFGLLTIALLLGISYSFGVYKVVLLRRVRKGFNTRLDGLDIKYFKVEVVNEFGKYGLWVYVLFPFLKPGFNLHLDIFNYEAVSFFLSFIKKIIGFFL